MLVRGYRLPSGDEIEARLRGVLADGGDSVVFLYPSYRYENGLKKGIERAVRKLGGSYVAVLNGYIASVMDSVLHVKIILDGR